MARTKQPERKRGMLKGIDFDEVSFVGKGANQGAHVSIIKMDDSPEEIAKSMFSDILGEMIKDQERYRFLDDLYLTNSALRRSTEHIIYNDNIVDKKRAILENLQQFTQSFASVVTDTGIIKSLEEILKGSSDEDKQKQEVEGVEKGIEFYKAQAMMTDEEKEIFKGLDEAGQDDIIKAASSEDKKALADKFKAMADKKKGAKKEEMTKGLEETVIVDGSTIAKSSVGEEAFAILKGMNERLLKSEQEVLAATAIAKEEQSKRLLKEASDEAQALWPNLPGDAISKGKTLLAIRSMPEDIQKSQMEMLSSGNASNDKLFKEYGGAGSVTGDANEKLNKMAKEHAATTGVPFHKAYETIMSTPEGQRLYEETLTQAN